MVYYTAGDNTVDENKGTKSRLYGFKMAIWGAFANSIGALVMYLIVIIITQTKKDVQYP